MSVCLFLIDVYTLFITNMLNSSNILQVFSLSLSFAGQIPMVFQFLVLCNQLSIFLYVDFGLFTEGHNRHFPDQEIMSYILF